MPSSPNQNDLGEKKKQKKVPSQQSQGENLLSTLLKNFPGGNQQQNLEGSKPFPALPKSQTHLAASGTPRWSSVAHPLAPLVNVPPLIHAFLHTFAHFFRETTANPLYSSHLTLPGSFLLQHLHSISQL